MINAKYIGDPLESAVLGLDIRQAFGCVSPKPMPIKQFNDCAKRFFRLRVATNRRIRKRRDD